jgi:multidrug efflux pump subunit AcrA (membrane-fusion protein)
MQKISLYLLLISLIAACHPKDSQETGVQEPEIITPVTVTSVSTDAMTEYIDLNATSSYLLKAVVKASANGYIQSVNAQPGQMVSSGQNLFTLKTKEAQSIGNTINLLDSSFKFSGIINMKAGTSGYVSEVNHQAGDYVQEGEQLAVINDANSFVFILNLPYELRPYVLDKKTAELLLPDGKKMTGNISSVMPVVDSVSQTQNIVIKVNERNLPVNLIAKVRVIKTARTNAVSLPKQSVLSDETQTNFWVMKVIDSTTTVRVPVTKGIETNDRVEILSPAFSPSDKFLLTGNYGLGDTAKIKIIRE